MKILLRNTFLRYIIISFTTFILSVSSYAAEVSIMATWGGDEEAGYRELLNGFTAKTGIDYISVGRLTHSAPWVDISLNFVN